MDIENFKKHVSFFIILDFFKKILVLKIVKIHFYNFEFYNFKQM